MARFSKQGRSATQLLEQPSLYVSALPAVGDSPDVLAYSNPEAILDEPSLYVGVNPSQKPLNGFLPDLSDNEKRLLSIGAIGLVGWFFFGKKIKKAMKK